jgi:hypothetical protein
MEEIHEYKKYKIFGITINVQLPELIDPSLNEIKMIVRKPRYNNLVIKIMILLLFLYFKQKNNQKKNSYLLYIDWISYRTIL